MTGIAQNTYPWVSIVMIGLDADRFLSHSIQAMTKVQYPSDRLEFIYVDGGSKDASVSIARTFPSIKVIELQTTRPTPGKGRNAGYKAARGSYIQFLDSDSYLHPLWIPMALPHFNEHVIAVCGLCHERYPEKNMYHVIAQKEWNGPEGFCEAFGGNVLVKKDALAAVQGYNENLVAGEDPELSYRLRREGGHIQRLNAPMVSHDVAMDNFYQYLKRATRTGGAYAEVSSLHRHEREKFWLRPLLRVIVSCIVPWIVLIAGSLLGHPVWAAAIAFTLALRTLRFIPSLVTNQRLSPLQALKYCLHLSFVVYPQFFGIIRYWTKTRP